MDGEFFLGLDKIQTISNDQPQELQLLVEGFEGVVRYDTYNRLTIGNELELYKQYTLNLATGTAGDSLNYHRGMYFTRSRQ